jgi:hypothetical protein
MHESPPPLPPPPSALASAARALAPPSAAAPAAPPARAPAPERAPAAPRPRSAFATWALSFAVGGASGATAKTIIAPLDRAKILFQISNERFSLRAVASSLATTLRTEGVRALFRGNAAQMLRIYPYSGIQLASFDAFTRVILLERAALGIGCGGGAGGAGGAAAAASSAAAAGSPSAAAAAGAAAAATLTPLDRVIAGSLAGAVSVAVTYPLDLMRARLAVMRESPGGARRYRGLAHAFAEMWREHGWRGFYRGMAPTLLGILPYAGISFATFGTLKQLSRDRKAAAAAAAAATAAGGAARGAAAPAAAAAAASLEPSNWERLLYGGVAGLAGQTSTCESSLSAARLALVFAAGGHLARE